ncbi:MAG TPA: hypothetical protein VMW35_15550 [Myxococcota bacterium]|nr:hypothetical protein [Myxococcota bacterium]
MTQRTRRLAVRMTAMALALGWLAAGLAPTAAVADEKVKTERSNGRLEKYDKAAQTITIKDKGKEMVFNVKAEGSVLTRTTVTVNAKPGKLDDLKVGNPVVVYWKADGDTKFARKIDMPNVPKELLEEEEGSAAE